MVRKFALEYWRDGDWFVGRLRDVPGVFSQGETLDELHENIRDAYQCMVVDSREPSPVDAVEEESKLEV